MAPAELEVCLLLHRNDFTLLLNVEVKMYLFIFLDRKYSQKHMLPVKQICC